ncbi:MAG: tRNA (N6-threonylcarbamoyladenosine(37)-N6)-methyltransferase TrmO [Firmicutes bacterium]|nr:tRNA (N6-threonylcarbamoyladenosine(37)-N6)-methyltransferase TrmO [Bacillota bacterium]
MKAIAHISTLLPEKFGVPRQAGLVPELVGKIIFEREFCREDFFRGLEGFSHIWLLWEFSETKDKGYSPTVRPPMLGGNKKIGVFATRSPFRPNPIGLSAVRLLEIERGGDGISLIVAGADLVNGTPILDIKPYLPYADSIPDAVGGFTENLESRRLFVVLPDDVGDYFDEETTGALRGALSLDPRPRYQDDGRTYGMSFAGCRVRFFVSGDTLTVTDIEHLTNLI